MPANRHSTAAFLPACSIDKGRSSCRDRKAMMPPTCRKGAAWESDKLDGGSGSLWRLLNNANVTVAVLHMLCTAASAGLTTSAQDLSNR
jgi:hypothetical protein